VGGTTCKPIVTISITPADGTSAWAYEEYLYGLQPSEISGNGAWLQSLSVIRWGTFLTNSSQSFSYTLTGAGGTYSIFGRESQDGTDTDTDSSAITIDCIPPPLEQVAAPVFDPPTNTDTPVTVTITTATEGAEIHYTTDGSPLSELSAVYIDPITINDRAVLQAIAVKAGMEDSTVSKAVYKRPYVPPAQNLERSIAWTACRPVVSIAVTPTDGTSAYAIEETLPPGLVPENISDNGVWNEDAFFIRWGAFMDGNPRTLTYELTGPDAVYSIAGTGSFDGRDQEISGTGQVSIDCIPEQAAIPVLSPGSGTRAPVTITMTTATEGAEIRYTTDGAEPDESSILYIAPVILDVAAVVKAKAFKAELAPSDTVQAEYLPAMRPKAIIVAGGGPFDGNSLWPATKHVSNYAYHALIYQGYAKDDIEFLSPDLTVDVDGNGELDDIDAEATRANLEEAVTAWAKDAEEVLLYMTDHGGNKTFMIGQNDILDAADLAGWIDTLQKTMTGRVTVIYDACQSGTFLSELTPPAGKERLVITSASNEPALFLEGGVLSFSYQFWSTLFLSGSLYDAYLNGRNLMKRDQRAMLDTDGNGIANEKQDKLLAADVIIGRGAVAASAPPDIQSFSGEQILTSSTSAVIWAADISSLDPISRVWAVIMPPNYHSGAVDIPIIDLPTLEMTDPDKDGRYEATYTGFTLHGTYRLLIYARDNQGVFSLPRQTIVIQNGGDIPENNPPVAENMIFSTNEDISIQEALSANDADGDTLNYIIVEDGAIGTVSITNVNTGAFIYQPHSNEHGSDSFTFKVNDGNIDSEIATVSVAISSVEDIPLAFDMDIVVERNNSVSGIFTAEDGDDDPVTFALAGQPGHGEVALPDAASGSFTYTPTAGYFGSDSFTFTADDGKAVSSQGTVSITIARGYNNPPSAQGVTLAVLEDTASFGGLEASDPENDPLTFTLVSAPVKGVVALTDPDAGSFTYTPYADLNGEDSFTYKVSDGLAESDPAACTILITPVNDSPKGKDGYLSVKTLSGAGGQLSATDVESDPLVFSIAANGQMGQAIITDSAVGAYTYTPDTSENGTDRFTFTVNDGDADSAPAEITVSILLPQAVISRTLSGAGCAIDVNLTVVPVATVKSYAVEELLPDGVFPADISENGVWDGENRTIKWGVFLDNASRTLFYSLTSDDGVYSISGSGSFDGWNQEISGDIQAQIACGAQRVETPVFDPQGGTRAPVDVTISSDTADAEIYYTTDGSRPDSDSDLYTAPLHFDDPVTLKARAFKEGMYESDIATSRYLPYRSHKAIIVAGGGPYTGNRLWSSTKLVGEYAYKALLYQGYAKEDIIFFSAGTDVDVDGNGILDDINGLAESSALEDAINTWALDAESLLLYMSDHGGHATFQLTPGDTLSATDLDAWLDTLQGSMDGTVIVVYDACRSGSFVEHLTPPAGKKRINITSASNESAWFLRVGKLSFSYQFWASIFGNANIYDAYYNAKRLMRRFQSALLDADGDGLVGEDEDWLAAKDIVIGRGAVAAGVAPEIGYVTPPRVLDTEISATIAAWNVTSLNDIERVWAIITPPGYAPDSPDDPVTEMTEIDLIDQDGDGTFEGTYDDFTIDGIYNIVVYAVDREGLFSQPAYTAVAKNCALPDGYEDDNTWKQSGVIVLNDENVQTRNLHGQNDRDWVKFYGVANEEYTVEVINPGADMDAVIEIYDSDGITLLDSIDDFGAGIGENIDWTRPQNGICYVMVKQSNSTGYGQNTAYDLVAYRSIGPVAAFFTGIVTDSSTGAPLGDVIIQTTGDASAISLLETGIYLFIHEPGTETLTAMAGGYETFTDSITVSEGGTISKNVEIEMAPLVDYYLDSDGDGYGNPDNSIQAGTQPEGYVVDNTDCDDSDANEHPGQTWYKDADNDGYSDGTTDTTSCTRPTGYKVASELTATSDDCNDNDVAINPGAVEVCNGVDDDCDTQIDEGVKNTYYRDVDEDGYGDPNNTTQACAVPDGYVTNSSDCDDNDPKEHPGQAWYKDSDNDGYSDGTTNTTSCTRPEGSKVASELTAISDDCNDNDAAIHPTATEVCNGVDDDCDTQIDEGVKNTYYRDLDGDGYGDPNSSTEACTQPEGYVANSIDCDDNNTDEHPGQTWYKDTDNDGYSDGTTETTSCTRPEGYKIESELTDISSDCDDNNAAIHPDTTEICNGVDDNCDGQIDEGVKTAYYRDADEDGYGDSKNTTQACTQPDGYVTNNTDCDDSDPKEHPGQTWYKDADNDDYSDGEADTTSCARPAGYKVASELIAFSGDCDDDNTSVNPGATEICNGIDDDCNGTIDDGCLRGDVNGDGIVDLADTILVLKVLAGIDTPGLIRSDYNTSGADVNDDTSIGLAEVIYILQKLSEVRK